MNSMILVLFLLSTAVDSGYLTVLTDRPGTPFFFDGDFVGNAPFIRVPVKAGEFSVVPASSDSLEALYWRLRVAGIGDKLRVLWTLARIDAATARVNIRPGYVTTVEMSGRNMEGAACRAKWLVFGTTGAVFLTGLLAGVVIHALAQ